MFDVKLTLEQRQYAWGLVQKHNFGNRGVFDGNAERQYTGILGQTVMADGLGMERPTELGGFDNGIDFTILGRNVDLKTMGRHSKPKWSSGWVNNLLESQTHYETDFYVFSSIHKDDRVMTVVGMISKPKVLRMTPLPVGTERRRHDGTTFNLTVPEYEIPNPDLDPLNGWHEITWSIDRSRLSTGQPIAREGQPDILSSW